jgi:hypothetical protein
MLSLVLLSAVSGTLYQLLLESQRISRGQTSRVALQSTMRGAAIVVASELRELSAASLADGQNDITSLAPHSITYRAGRGFGYTCQALAGGALRIARSVFSGQRDPQPGRDSVLVYAPDVLHPADSGWSALAIAAVSTAGTCPGGAGPAITLTSVGAGADIPAGSPVRIYEPMQLALYQSDGQQWLGMRSLSSGEAIQPLFGPLLDADGFRLDFADAAGTSTGLASEVRSVTVSLRAAGSESGASGTPPVEQLVTWIALRNGTL